MEVINIDQTHIELVRTLPAGCTIKIETNAMIRASWSCPSYEGGGTGIGLEASVPDEGTYRITIDVLAGIVAGTLTLAVLVMQDDGTVAEAT